MWPLVLIAGYLIYNYINSAKQFQEKKQIRVHSVKFNLTKSATTFFNTLFFDVVVKIDNPTEFTASVTGSRFAILYQGVILGASEQAGAVKLAPKSETAITLTGKVYPASVAAQFKPILEALKTGKQTAFTVKGEISTTLGAYTFNQTMNVL